jgi:hypothetical protein
MAPLFRAFGVLALAGACISAVLGLLSLAPGGLMFGLPYFFFGLGIALAVVGGVCLVAARGTRRRSAVVRDTGEGSAPEVSADSEASPPAPKQERLDIRDRNSGA